MEHLLGEEERELGLLLADHCRELLVPEHQRQRNSNNSNNTAANDSSSARGAFAHTIAVVLAECGWTNAVDLREYIKSHRFASVRADVPVALLDSEDALRAELKRLMHHDILRHDSRTSRYNLNLQHGVLRLLFPLMVQPVVRAHQHSAVAEAALLLLYEHHDLPLPTLTNVVLDSSSSMQSLGRSTVEGVVRSLHVDRWIIQVGSAASTAAGGSGTGGANTTSIESYGINYAKFLARYRSDISLKYACENLSPVQRTVAQWLADQRKPEAQLSVVDDAESNPSPRLPLYGEDKSATEIRQGLMSQHRGANASADHASIVRELAAQPQALIQLTGSSKSSNSSGSNVTARFSFEGCNSRLKRTLMCAEIRARFGLVGQRVVKILLDHRALEDRHLASEGLISLPDLHSLLVPMQQLGILYHQELLRPQPSQSVTAQIQNNSGPDRQMKHSVFLWTVQERQLLSLVRKRVCRSICALRMRLRSEYRGSGAAAAAGAIRQRGGAGGNSGDADDDDFLATLESRQSMAVATAARQRFEAIQDHLSKALVALYEELAITYFF